MSKTSKPRPKGRGARAPRDAQQERDVVPKRSVRSESTKIPIHGLQRQRRGARMQRIRGLRRAIPAEAAQTLGYRLPAEAATPAQEKILERMVRDYLRYDFMYTYRELPPETLAQVLGISERAAYSLAAKVRRLPFSPKADLVVNVLHAMFSSEIAGVLGTRKTGTTRWLFRMVDEHDLTDGAIRGRLWYDDNGERVDDERANDSHDTFRCLHAAFRLDYSDWLERK